VVMEPKQGVTCDAKETHCCLYFDSESKKTLRSSLNGPSLCPPFHSGEYELCKEACKRGDDDCSMFRCWFVTFRVFERANWNRERASRFLYLWCCLVPTFLAHLEMKRKIHENLQRFIVFVHKHIKKTISTIDS